MVLPVAGVGGDVLVELNATAWGSSPLLVIGVKGAVYSNIFCKGAFN
jgi:hypothetical protein